MNNILVLTIFNIINLYDSNFIYIFAYKNSINVMKQEDKELLLKDISERLIYGVICNDSKHGDSRITEVDIVDETVYCDDFDEYSEIKNIKPYLRQIYSMTEEEKLDIYKVAGFYYLSNFELLRDEWRSFKSSIEENVLFFPYPIWLDNLQKVSDWLNAHHFDYRGLIEKGLAIEVTEENNPYKE